jgi:hypothetical protein
VKRFARRQNNNCLVSLISQTRKLELELVLLGDTTASAGPSDFIVGKPTS